MFLNMKASLKWPFVLGITGQRLLSLVTHVLFGTKNS